MNDCPNGEIRDLLPDLLHHRLAPDAQRLVEAHVSACARCQEELALLRGMSRALRRAPAVDVGEIVAAIPAYRASARRYWSGWRIAAAITFVAAGGTSLAVVRHREVAPGENVGVATAVTPDSRGGDPDSARPLVVAPVPMDASSRASGAAGAPATRELAVASATIADLDERELSTLLQDLESIDAMPSVEVEPGAPVSPIRPVSPSGADE